MKTSINYRILLILFLSSTLMQSQIVKDIKPIDKKQPVKVLTGKKKTYYQLSDLLNYKINDFDKVVVYSRKRIKKNNQINYKISYRFDDNKTNTYSTTKTKTDPASAYTQKSLNRKVSHFYKKEISIPTSASLFTLLANNNKEIDVKVIGYKSDKKIIIKPIDPQTKTIIRTGTIFKYYKLNSKIKTKIKLDKPGKLIVYTRMRLDDKDGNSYSFSYKINKTKFKKKIIKDVKPATKTMYKSFYNKKRPSTFHKTVIIINESDQQIEFTSKDAVDARFVMVQRKNKINWTQIKPKNKNPIILTTNKTNKDRIYTRITDKKPIIFNVDAKETTKIKLFVRGEFTYDMLSNDYEIVLKEDGKIINTYRLSCDRSKKMKYKNNDEMIPGTLDKVFIKIPKGKHQYSINVNNKGKSVLIRILRQK